MEAKVELAALCLLIGVLVGCCLVLALRRPSPAMGFIPAVRNPAVHASHLHEATTMTAGGWFCECGAHFHRFSRVIAGSANKRCMCGKEGTTGSWQ